MQWPHTIFVSCIAFETLCFEQKATCFFLVIPSVGWEYVHVNIYFQALASQLHGNWTFSAAVLFLQAVNYFVFILYATFCKYVLLWSVACVSPHHLSCICIQIIHVLCMPSLVRPLHSILWLSFPYARTATLLFVSAVFHKCFNSYPPIFLYSRYAWLCFAEFLISSLSVFKKCSVIETNCWVCRNKIPPGESFKSWSQSKENNENFKVSFS